MLMAKPSPTWSLVPGSRQQASAKGTWAAAHGLFVAARRCWRPELPR